MDFFCVNVLFAVDWLYISISLHMEDIVRIVESVKR